MACTSHYTIQHRLLNGRSNVGAVVQHHDALHRDFVFCHCYRPVDPHNHPGRQARPGGTGQVQTIRPAEITGTVQFLEELVNALPWETIPAAILQMPIKTVPGEGFEPTRG